MAGYVGALTALHGLPAPLKARQGHDMGGSGGWLGGHARSGSLGGSFGATSTFPAIDGGVAAEQLSFWRWPGGGAADGGAGDDDDDESGSDSDDSLKLDGSSSSDDDTDPSIGASGQRRGSIDSASGATGSYSNAASKTRGHRGAEARRRSIGGSGPVAPARAMFDVTGGLSDPLDPLLLGVVRGGGASSEGADRPRRKRPSGAPHGGGRRGPGGSAGRGPPGSAGAGAPADDTSGAGPAVLFLSAVLHVRRGHYQQAERLLARSRSAIGTGLAALVGECPYPYVSTCIHLSIHMFILPSILTSHLPSPSQANLTREPTATSCVSNN